jgi:hypothetical protein
MNLDTIDGLREALYRESRRSDEIRRKLSHEYDLRTRALQASHDRLLGLLSGEIAREPMPPIIIHCPCAKDCKACARLPKAPT